MYFWHDKGCLMPFVECISLVVFDYTALFFSHGFLSGQDICIRWVTAAVILSENEICLFLCLISDVLKTQISAYAVFLHKEGDKLSCTNQLLRRHETQFRKALILSSFFSDMRWCHYTTNIIIYTIKFNCYRYDNIQLIQTVDEH